MDNIESSWAIFQASAFYEHFYSGPPSLETFLRDEHRKNVFHRPQSPEKAFMKNFMPVSTPSSINSNGLGFQATTCYNLYERRHDSVTSNLKPECNDTLCSIMINGEDEYNGNMHSAVAVQFSSPNDGKNVSENEIQELGRQGTSKNKRPAKGESAQELKKQCLAPSAAKSAKSESTAKDPLSIAAKNRRERISERLKTLQELVPNGSKVDLVTMLEKAISYVKFLQLQVKVLASDEFWPSHGGKAPELSQVKEAIDAILGSQRERSD